MSVLMSIESSVVLRLSTNWINYTSNRRRRKHCSNAAAPFERICVLLADKYDDEASISVPKLRFDVNS